MIPFTVIGGYLGAGKTTLLNHLLLHNEGRRFALLINDFGDINIDAELIESKSEKQINLANGCVCCTLSDGFFEALETLKALTPPPEHIVVEASGVANVANLAQYGQGDGLTLDGIIVVADAETVIDRANDKYVASTVRRQLEAADLIVLNKTDLVSAEQLRSLRDWLGANSGGARVLETVRGRVPTALLLGVAGGPRASGGEHRAHESYAAWSYRSDRCLDEARVHRFLEGLGEEVIRAKGLLALSEGGCLEVQQVGRRVELRHRPERPAPGCQLVVIGLADQLQTEVLDRLAAACFA